MQRKILVIEDIDDYATYVASSLRRVGFDAVGVPYETSARATILAIHGEGELGLVIVDLGMRTTLGLEALRFLSRHLPEVPVIGIGDPADPTIDALATLRARGIFRKPLDWEDLLVLIRYTLAEVPAPATNRAPVSTVETLRPRRRIVLVGDLQEFCEALACDLERRGHEVAAFLDGNDAIKMLARHPASWDLVVINQDEGAGQEFRDYLATVWPDLPVLMASGWPNLLDECRNAEDGAGLSRAA